MRPSRMEIVIEIECMSRRCIDERGERGRGGAAGDEPRFAASGDFPVEGAGERCNAFIALACNHAADGVHRSISCPVYGKV